MSKSRFNIKLGQIVNHMQNNPNIIELKERNEEIKSVNKSITPFNFFIQCVILY